MMARRLTVNFGSQFALVSYIEWTNQLFSHGGFFWEPSERESTAVSVMFGGTHARALTRLGEPIINFI